MTILESYLDKINNEAINPSVIASVAAGTMAASALFNALASYKERVVEFGKNKHECDEKCKLRFDINNTRGMSKEDKERVARLRKDCLNKCAARYYKDLEAVKAKREKIKQKIEKIKAFKRKKG